MFDRASFPGYSIESMLTLGRKLALVFYGLRFNCLLGPLIFTNVNMKRRPATTKIVSSDMDSCPFVLVVVIPH